MDKYKYLDEVQLEREESKAHIKRAVMQSVQDVRQFGTITKGEQMYLEQIGLNVSWVFNAINQYLDLERNNMVADISKLYDFLEEISTAALPACKIRMDLIGIDNELMVDNLYKKEKLAFPSKQSEERKKLDEIIRSSEKWDEVSTLDTFALEKIVRSKKWNEDLLNNIKKFSKTEFIRTVIISKLKDKED